MRKTKIIMEVEYGSDFQEQVSNNFLRAFLFTFATDFLRRHKKNNIKIDLEETNE